MHIYKDMPCRRCGKNAEVGDYIIYMHMGEISKPGQPWRSQAKNQLGVKMNRGTDAFWMHEECARAMSL